MKRVSIKNKIFLFLLVVCFSTVIICSTLISKNKNETPSILTEMKENAGNYDETKIVLSNTNHNDAKNIALKLNAKLRITTDGSYATITLPSDVTIEDVVKDKNNEDIIHLLSLDYKASISETDESIDFLPSKPNYQVDDPYFSYQSYLDYLNLDNVWNSYQGYNTTVAIIDTGIDTDHPEFTGRISEYSYNASSDKIVKDYLLEDGSYDWSLIEDVQGHGTSVAGVIGASLNNGIGIAGIAPNVELLVIKAECNEKGNFYNSSDLVFGLYYAIERDVDVVNMSFSGGGDFSAPAKLAKDSDIICVAAAGNDGSPTVSSPAALDDVIGVGALASNSWELASYSNYGDGLDVVAPGTVYTTAIGGGYHVMNGTSFSSPIVAGLAILYKQNNKYAEFEQFKEVLYASSKDLGSLGQDFVYGYGAVDASALLLEEKCTVTFNYLTDEIEETKQIFIKNHPLQNIPEPDRNYAVFDGWNYDIYCTEQLDLYRDKWNKDLTLYASWGNEDDTVPYTYVTLDDGTIEIRSYTGHRRYITIPDYIDDKVVSSIGDNAFNNETRLRMVNLPRYLTNIGTGAFYNCNNLLSISIPKGVKKIGDSAFANNTRLQGVVFEEGSSLTHIGHYAFAYTALRSIIIPKNVSYVNGSAFLGTTRMQNYFVEKKNNNFITSNGVLYNKTGSNIVAYPAGRNGNFTIPNIVRNIDTCAFAYAKFTTIDLNKVKTIGVSAFMYSSLEEIDIKDTVTTIDVASFLGCFNLTNVRLGKGISNIPGGLNEGAFEYCSSLKTITIPSNIITIGQEVFCSTGLENVNFEENSNLVLIGGSAFGGTPLNKIKIPKSVLEIGSYAFYRTALQEVTFEENASLRIIGSSAFLCNFNLTTIELPNSLSVIGSSAFACNYGLTSIELPESLEELGSYAFMESGLTGEVRIPKNLITLNANPFASCPNLTSFNVDTLNPVYQSINGIIYSKENVNYMVNGNKVNPNGYAIIAYPAGLQDSTYTIINNTSIIEDSAFYGVKNLVNVNINEEMKELHRYAFYECSSLSYIHIPDEVMQISNYAFALTPQLNYISFGENSKLPRISIYAFARSGITSFDVPKNVSTIAKYAFYECNNLTTITFKANSKLTTIAGYQFDGCKNLQSVIFEEGSSLTNIEAHAFENSGIYSIDFGNANVTNIDNYAFRYCFNLQSIVIPSTVTYIGRYAFYGDESISSIVIPESVEYIGRFAFYTKNNVIDIYFKSDNMPSSIQENWDEGIKGYYMDVSEIKEANEFKYALLSNGNVSLIEYLGTSKQVDLTTLTFEGLITTIGGYAFYRKEIEEIILPNTITSIGQYAFANSSIKRIEIPNSVNFIGKYAFYNTQKLTEVVINKESSLRRIEKYAFSLTRSLSKIYIPKEVESLGSYVFYNSGIVHVFFDQDINLQEIPEHAFDTTRLTSIIIPNSVTLINHNAFRDTLSLTEVTWGSTNEFTLMSNVFYNTGLSGTLVIPENLVYIGEYSFNGLVNLDSFNVDENNNYYKSVDGVLYSKDGKRLISFPGNRKGTFEVPNNVETIGFGAFENTKLTNVTFEENINLLTIGYRAFFNADSLITINIPSSVVSIDYYAFAYSDSLTTVNFDTNSRLTGIYEGAFYGCKSLKNIQVPNSIIEISDYAFYGCISLDKLPISEDSNVKGIYDYVFAYTGIKELILPDSVIDIGRYAFKESKLKKVYISNTNLETLVIEFGAFEACNELEDLTLPFTGRSLYDDIVYFTYIFGAGSIEASYEYMPSSLKHLEFIQNDKNIKKYEWNDIFGSVIYDNENSIYISLFKNIETIILPNNITNIDSSSFYNCTNLTSIEVQESVTSIGNSAFYNCDSLTNITLPNSVTTIENNTFAGCSSLESIEIPNSVISLGRLVFFDCTSLISVTLLDGMKNIGSCAFWNCSSLTSIEIPNSVISIGSSAFYNCSSLTSIEIPSTISNIENDTFSNCSSLTSIIISNGVTSIGERAFSDCISLTSIELPDSLTSIGSLAFSDCISLMKVKRIAMDESIYSIKLNSSNDLIGLGDSVFQSCDSLTSVEIPKGITKIGNNAFADCSSLISVKIPDSVTSIGNNAFSWCSSLTSIIIPNSIISIGDGVFNECSGIVSITIPEGVKNIGEWTFSNCDNLIDIELPNSIISINSYAFNGCNSLTNIILPSNLDKIADHAFDSCNKLHYIINNSDLNLEIGSESYGSIAYYAKCIVDKNGNKTYKDEKSELEYTNIEYIDTIDGFRFMKENNQYTLIAYLGTEDTVTLPLDINGNEYMMNGIIGVKNVIIPNGMTKIKSGAFENSISLTSVTIPNTVTSIEWNAFAGCSKLTKIEIPNSVTSIGDYAFSNCSSLTSVTIPKGVMSIGYGTFSGCSSLTNIIIPNGVTSIGGSAFFDCTSLVNVEIPNSVTSIEWYTFYGCCSLTNIVIPNSVKLIGGYAFYNCSNLASIEIPKEVTSIEYSAFLGCNNLNITINEENTNYKCRDGVIYDFEMTKIIYTLDNVREITIPNTVIEFTLNTNLENIYFEENSTINIINDYQFENFKNLKIVKLPNSITYIGINAFFGCSSLTSIEIPTSVTDIRDYAFSGCSSLTSILIPDSVINIGSCAFSNCTNLIEIDLSQNMISIEYGLFANCSSLTDITIPDKVTSIGALALTGCNALKSIQLPNTIVSIGAQAFENCSSLKSIELPQGITSIENAVFYCCSSLTSIEIPIGVTSIGALAFYDCDSLTSIEIPIGVESIEDHTFQNCSSLVSVIIPSSVKKIKQEVFLGCENLKEIKIPDSVTSIGDSAFASCSSLTRVEMSDSVTSIGNKAFANCNSLTMIELSNNVTNIWDHAFYGCSNLIKIKLPSNLTSIGDFAFYGCRNLTNIIIPNSIDIIEESAFSNCNNLYYITNNSELNLEIGSESYGRIAYYAKCIVDKNGNKTYKDENSGFEYIDTVDGFRFVKENNQYTLIAYLGNEDTVILPLDINGNEYKVRNIIGVKKIIIPEGVTSIEDNAFYNCDNITSVTLPNSVTSIGNNAFRNCDRLKNIEMSNNITSIGQGAFSGCSSLVSINIPEGVKSISYSTFEDCWSLVSITISERVTSIGRCAFLNCISLTNITMPSNVTSIGEQAFGGCSSLKSIIIPKGVTSIEDFTFSSCNSLTNIEIPSTVKSIGSSAFSNCYSLANIEIPEEVVIIQPYTFSGCSNLTSIVISNSVTNIGWDAFYNCSNLIDIKLPKKCSLGDRAFTNTAFYNDKDNWINGCLYLDNYLIDVDTSVETLTISNDTILARDALYELYNLKNLDINYFEYGFLISVTNLVSLNVPTTCLETCSISSAFNYNIPLTLTNVILKDCTYKINSDAFSDITGINIFVDEYKENLMWDQDTPNWNNGNKVYYKGEWTKAEFYDVDGKWIDTQYRTISQIIKQPHISSIIDKEYSTIFEGWDIDGDGIVDVIPATSTSDIIARAIMKTVKTEYKVNFINYDENIIETIIYHYNDLIVVPTAPTRYGYIFKGWSGYTDGMTATQDYNFYAVYEHINGSHDYVKEVIEATCEHEGCDLYICSICNESYKENIKPQLEHSYGEWIIDKEAECEEKGLKYHVCENCNHKEYMDIEAIGHDYIETIKTNPTCEHTGLVEYICNNCNDQKEEELPLLEHEYKKVVVQKSWLKILIETLLNMFFGYEGNNAYYYMCVNCHHIMTNTELSSVLDSSTSSNCEHIEGEWETITEPSCIDGISGRYCKLCGKLVEAKVLEKTGIHTSSDWIIDEDPTCTVNGSKHKECTVCHETLETEVINKLGHDLEHHDKLDPTCTASGHTEYDTCSRCDYTTYKELPTTGHKESNWIIDKDSTCLVDGSKHKECTVCHETLVTEVINKLGHDLIHHEKLDPTCTTKGHTEYDTCSRCDYTTFKELPTTGHKESNWIIDKDSTCLLNGSKHKECTVCHENLVTEIINKLGHDLIHHEKLDPTCTASGHTEYDTCSRCDYTTYKELPATGHKESDWIVDVEATTNEKGHKHKECTVCHEHLKEKDIPRVSSGFNCNSKIVGLYNSLLVLSTALLMLLRFKKKE